MSFITCNTGVGPTPLQPCRFKAGFILSFKENSCGKINVRCRPCVLVFQSSRLLICIKTASFNNYFFRYFVIPTNPAECVLRNDNHRQSNSRIESLRGTKAPSAPASKGGFACFPAAAPVLPAARGLSPASSPPRKHTSHPRRVPAALSLLLHLPQLPLGLPGVTGRQSFSALRPRLSVARRRGSAGALGAAAWHAGPAVARRSAAPPVCC